MIYLGFCIEFQTNSTHLMMELSLNRRLVKPMVSSTTLVTHSAADEL